MTRGFIQNQYARILQNHTRQRDALFLSAAQTIAALASDCIITIGQVNDEVMVSVTSAVGELEGLNQQRGQAVE